MHKLAANNQGKPPLLNNKRFKVSDTDRIFGIIVNGTAEPGFLIYHVRGLHS